MKANYKLTDEEILLRRRGGKTIEELANEAGVGYVTMQKKLKALQKVEIARYDTLGDGKGGFWTVTEVTDTKITAKNRETHAVVMIDMQRFQSGKTNYHKLDTPPVKVYNLNDVDPPKEKAAAPAEEVKEPAETSVKPFLAPPEPARRRYIEQIENLLDAAQLEQQSEVKYLYYLVHEIFKNGFDAEFKMEDKQE